MSASSLTLVAFLACSPQEAPTPAPTAPAPAADDGTAPQETPSEGGPSDPALAPGDAAPPDELATLTADLTSWLLERRPWLEHERGVRAAAPLGLGRFSPGHRVDAIAELGRIEARLADFDARGLEPARIADLQALSAEARFEGTLLQAFAPERWHVERYVDHVEELLAPLSGLRAARDLESVLAGLPDYWRDARRALTRPAVADLGRVLARLEAIAELSSALSTEVAVTRAVGSDAALLELGREARVATHDFRTWLGETEVASVLPEPRMGAALWLAAVTATSGTELDIEGLRRRLLEDLAVLEREHGEVWRVPRQPDPLPSDAWLTVPRDIMVVALEGVRASGALAVPEGAGQIRLLESETDWVRLSFPVEALATERDRRSFAATPRLGVPSRLKDASHAALTTFALRYGVPGEAMFAEATHAGRSELERFHWNRATFDGWGLYALDWLRRIELDREASTRFLASLDPTAQLEGAIAREQLEAASLLLATLELHADELPFDEAVRRLSRRGAFEPDRARAVLERALADPLLGIGYLGWIELRALEAAAREREADPWTALRTTLALVVTHPHLRPADGVRWLLESR